MTRKPRVEIDAELYKEAAMAAARETVENGGHPRVTATAYVNEAVREKLARDAK